MNESLKGIIIGFMVAATMFGSFRGEDVSYPSCPSLSCPQDIITCPNPVVEIAGAHCIVRSEVSPFTTNFIQASHRVEAGCVETSEIVCVVLGYGSSMQPTIFEGNTVEMVEYSGADLHPGDIVFADVLGEQYIHRVKTLGVGGVVLQGDNNAIPDTFVSYSNVSHVAVAVHLT